MSDLKWLLVGAGDIARKRVAAALQGAAGSELVGVCDLDEGSARQVAEEHGAAAVYTDLDEALSRCAAEAVYVATPVWLHAPQAVKALEAGRHVLVEKPLGQDRAACGLACEAAARTGRTAGCSYYRRLFPAYTHTRQMLERGDFGRLVLARMVYFSWFSPTPDDPRFWRVVRGQSGGGPLSDMATHMFDVLIGLLGMPASVYARCGNLVHDWEVEDTASIVLAMPDGVQVTAAFAWNSKTWRHEFELVGSEAKVYWEPYDAGRVVVTKGRDVEELDLSPAANVHQPLVEDFVEAVRDGREPACPLTEATHTNTLLEGVYRSAEEGREVSL
ncbi:Gfo/Idh/MocA family protein [Candidatus Latescibacterota bacterium]